jgi:hypothetical protein
MSQGKVAMTKSMMMLYTGYISEVQVRRRSLLTIAALLEVLTEPPVQVKVESVPDIVARLVDDPRPLKDALRNHVGVHGDNTEPEDPLGPAFSELQQCGSKRCFTQGLPNQGSAGCDVDEDLHPVIPLVDDITGRVFKRNQAVVDGENDLDED